MKSLYLLKRSSLVAGMILLTPSLAWAYANFIGHGYTSCLNCHYNPFGGGQLNDYGRAVSATGISSRVLYPEKWDEEKIAYTSGFLFRKPKQNFLRTQINYRGFRLIRNPNSKDETQQWITMQSDARATLKFGDTDQFIVSAEYGRVPNSNNPPPGMSDNKYKSRSHFIGYKFNENLGLYAGLMDKVYGIRVVEHPSFSRMNPQVSQNDTTHGIAAHLMKDKWEGGLHAFVGNLSQDADQRMKGASTMVERTIFDLHRIGASFLSSKNDAQRLTSYSVHGRFNIKEGSALLTEIGQTDKSFENNKNNRTTRYALLQTYLRPVRGFYVLSNIEYQRSNIHQRDYAIRWGPGLQYFPIQRVELRADAYNTRTITPSTSRKDSWMLVLQTHIWL